MGQRQSTIIPKAPVGRILMQAGAKRVSADAVNAFVDVLEKIATEVGVQSVKIAKHSGRKTVNGEDIRLAARR